MSLKVSNNNQNITLPEILNKHGQKQTRFKVLKSIEEITGVALSAFPKIVFGTAFTAGVVGAFVWPAVILSIYGKTPFWKIMGLSCAAGAVTPLAAVAAVAAIALVVFAINYAVRKMTDVNKVFESFDRLQNKLTYLSEIGLHKDVITAIYNHKEKFNAKRQEAQGKTASVKTQKEESKTKYNDLTKQTKLSQQQKMKEQETLLRSKSITGSEFIKQKAKIQVETGELLKTQLNEYQSEMGELQKQINQIYHEFNTYEKTVLQDIEKIFNDSLKTSYEEYQTAQLVKNPNAVAGKNYTSQEKFEQREREKYIFTPRTSTSSGRGWGGHQVNNAATRGLSRVMFGFVK